MALNVPQAVQIASRWHCEKANVPTSTRPGTTLVRSASWITGQNLSLYDVELRASAISTSITSSSSDLDLILDKWKKNSSKGIKQAHMSEYIMKHTCPCRY